MSDGTSIEWCDATWNPLRGCTRVSQGCVNCYAETVAARFSGPGQAYEGLAKWVGGDARWTGKVVLVEKALDQPLRWRRPRRIFVNSMSDLFHESVPDEWIDRIFAVMQRAGRHTFQVLTKRPERARAYLSTLYAQAGSSNRPWFDRGFSWPLMRDQPIPFPNVWLGASVEDQAAADGRIPILIETPAAVRFISAEPLLGPVDLAQWLHDSNCPAGSMLRGACICSDPREVHIDWVIAGGESGPGARPMHPQWARDLRDQCAAAGVAFLFKQWGAWSSASIGEDGEISHPLPVLGFKSLHYWDGGIVVRPNGAAPVSEVFRPGRLLALPVGKSAAGRLLDGVEHNQFPEQRG